MITLSKIKLDQSAIQAVTQVLELGQLAQGPGVEKLETQFSKLTQSSHAIALSNGTTALHAALLALDIKPGDEVITTPFTFVATANSIVMCGAIPIFIDIDPRTYNLDPHLIEPAITKKTKAILAVNLYGLPANWKVINTIARRHHLKTIEDAAQSIGAIYGGKRSGSLADIATFSLYATKNLMCGEGGMVTTNSPRLANRVRLLRHHGQSHARRYYYQSLGYNYRLTDIQAAIAISELKNLALYTQKRQAIAHKYNQAFGKIPGLITPLIPPHATHVFHQYTLRLTQDFPTSRDQLQAHLAQKGIQSNIYYPFTLDRVKHLASKHSQSLTHSHKAARQVLSIPVHPHLTAKEVQYIIDTVTQVAAQKRKS